MTIADNDTAAPPPEFRDRLAAALAHAADKAKAGVPDMERAYNWVHHVENALHCAAAAATDESRLGYVNHAVAALADAHVAVAAGSRLLLDWCRDHGVAPPPGLAGAETAVAAVAKDTLPAAEVAAEPAPAKAAKAR